MIFFWLRWASLLRGPFSGIQEQGLLSRAVRGLLTAEASLDSAGARGSGLVAGAPRLSRTGLVARGHVESSQTRDQTHIPCTGRCILNHRTTREVLDLSFKLDPAPWPWLNVSWRCHRFFDSTGATGKTPSSLSQPKVHKKKK